MSLNISGQYYSYGNILQERTLPYSSIVLYPCMTVMVSLVSSSLLWPTLAQPGCSDVVWGTQTSSDDPKINPLYLQDLFWCNNPLRSGKWILKYHAILWYSVQLIVVKLYISSQSRQWQYIIAAEVVKCTSSTLASSQHLREGLGDKNCSFILM